MAVAKELFNQVINVLRPLIPGATDAEVIDAIFGLVAAIEPGNALEGMTATLLIGAHQAAMDTLRRALHPDQTAAGRQMYLGLAMKSMKAYAALLEALNRGRGKGATTVQRIVVEKIAIAPGAQAVVGNVRAMMGDVAEMHQPIPRTVPNE